MLSETILAPAAFTHVLYEVCVGFLYFSVSTAPTVSCTVWPVVQNFTAVSRPAERCKLRLQFTTQSGHLPGTRLITRVNGTAGCGTPSWSLMPVALSLAMHVVWMPVPPESNRLCSGQAGRCSGSPS